MLNEQRQYWKSLRWFEKVIVIKVLVPGGILFASYLETLIYVVKMFTQ